MIEATAEAERGTVDLRSRIARVAGAFVAAATLLAVGVGGAAAHHSYPAAYDTTQSVTVAGTVVELHYVSPHVLAHLETPPEEEGAEPRVWVLDLPAPSRAQNIGLTREALEVGTSLTVTAWPSRTKVGDLAPTHITFDATGETIRLR
jgi:uncharacterized protein DUF6152